ncbi:Dabb family protein [Jiulongibacter sp. NS-SX5]|uniref:Dabb family protein n=1 Tax=Jiulongibacter sp. NS-SX5 TaxID=3463854 RepID=UPI00405A2419
MKKLSILLLAAAAIACNTETTTVEENVTEVTTDPLSEPADINPFIHHVYFYLNNPESVEDRDKLVEGLNKLAEVETIQAHYIGFPASTDREVIVKDYQVSWMCFFKNLEEEEMYQKDPIHLKFIEDYGHLWSTVKVYDSIGE